MQPYTLIFINSMQSSFVLALRSENAWFAAVEFGKYNIYIATLAAIIGSSLGNFINFAAGYYISRSRENWVFFDQNIYEKVAKYFSYSAVLLLLSFPTIPIIGVFYPIFVILHGVLRTSIIPAIGLIFLGRIIYYSYYLLTLPIN
ncbi:MAG: hypothetical protein WCL30_00495 [Pseudomonadota bacterium]